MNLSIITVCLNSEKVIEKTINSILSQTVPVFEYIIVDGVSTDNTIKILEKYEIVFQSRGISFKWISEPDNGISDAFNKGIKMASGELIGLINADDELKPRTNEVLQDNYCGEFDIYYGDCDWVDEKSNLIITKKPKHQLKRLLYTMVLYHPSTFVKRNVYDECGLFDVSYKYCMDKHFLYRCYLRKKRFKYIDESLTLFKAGGVSDNNAKRVFREGSRMALEYGEPLIKVKTIEIYKNIRETLVRLIKKTRIYIALISWRNKS